MGREKVVRFSRHSRQHRHYDLGTPPGQRRRGRLGRPWRSRRNLVLALLGAVLFLPPVVTFAVGVARPTAEGCRVVAVIDGDTARIWCPADGLQSTRLTGFDTPELKGQCASERLQALAASYLLQWQLLRAREIGLEPAGRDRYGRRLAALRVDGVPLAERMVASGLARPYDGGRRAGWCSR